MISLNPGPFQTQLNDDKTWDPLKTKGLHFCHLNVNSLLSKIDEIRDIVNRIKPAVLRITESKLDSSVTNMEVISMVTVSLKMTETDMVVALHVTLKMIYASILKKVSAIQLSMYFSKF